MTNLDPAVIERLRQSGIRIDREGEFQHEGAPVLHEGLRQALFRWLDRLHDGRVVRCAARGGKLEARLSTAAAAALADLIDDGAKPPVLALGGRRYPLRPRR